MIRGMMISRGSESCNREAQKSATKDDGTTGETSWETIRGQP